MNSVTFFCLVVLSVVLTSCNGQDKKETKVQDQSISKIEVMGFHSTHRCFTCKAIEANTKYTLETYFKEELKTGKITFSTTNVDEKANEQLAEKFEATGTALFLNIINKGTEKRINLTEFAFMKGKDKDKFSTELKAKIESELASL